MWLVHVSAVPVEGIGLWIWSHRQLQASPQECWNRTWMSSNNSMISQQLSHLPSPRGSFKYFELKWISKDKVSLYLRFLAWGFPCSKRSIFLDLSLTLEVEHISLWSDSKKRRLLKCNWEPLKSSMICQSMDTCSFQANLYTDSTTLGGNLRTAMVGSRL